MSRFLLSLALLLTCLEAAAESTALDWDCWIGRNAPVRIYCIHAPENLPVHRIADMETALLNHIHRRIHEGGTGELEELITRNASVFQVGSIWNIKIHTYPSETAWEEGRPAALVRALLCPAGYNCSVMVNRE